MSCAFKGCKNCRRLTVNNEISYYVFPERELLQKEWLKVLEKTESNWSWSKNKVVCSQHFKETDFIMRAGKRSLKVNAVPSLKLAGPIDTEKFRRPSSSGGRKMTVKKHKELLSSPTSSFETTASTSRDLTESTVFESTSSSLTDESQDKAREKIQCIKRKRKLESKARKVTSSSNTSTESSGTKRRRIQFIKAEHSYSTSPTIIKQKNIHLKKRQEAYRQKLFRRNKEVKLLKQRVNDMKVIMNYLKKNQAISNNAADHLEKT